MPYIREGRRAVAWKDFHDEGTVETVGDLNFLITSLCLSYLNSHNEPLSYKCINDIIGVLECAKQEFFRRVAMPYENQKRAENGDVY